VAPKERKKSEVVVVVERVRRRRASEEFIFNSLITVKIYLHIT
jgi:hypothetical protein